MGTFGIPYTNWNEVNYIPPHCSSSMIDINSISLPYGRVLLKASHVLRRNLVHDLIHGNYIEYPFTMGEYWGLWRQYAGPLLDRPQEQILFLKDVKRRVYFHGLHEFTRLSAALFSQTFAIQSSYIDHINYNFTNL